MCVLQDCEWNQRRNEDEDELRQGFANCAFSHLGQPTSLHPTSTPSKKEVRITAWLQFSSSSAEGTYQCKFSPSSAEGTNHCIDSIFILLSTRYESLLRFNFILLSRRYVSVQRLKIHPPQQEVRLIA